MSFHYSNSYIKDLKSQMSIQLSLINLFLKAHNLFNIKNLIKLFNKTNTIS